MKSLMSALNEPTMLLRATMIARAIITAEAVTAAPPGWRCRLPSASAPLAPEQQANQRVEQAGERADQRRGQPDQPDQHQHQAQAGPAGGVGQQRQHAQGQHDARAAMVPRVTRRCSGAGGMGRRASSTGTRLAARAGTSPASTVTPMPRPMASATTVGVITSSVMRMRKYYSMIPPIALVMPAANR